MHQKALIFLNMFCKIKCFICIVIIFELTSSTFCFKGKQDADDQYSVFLGGKNIFQGIQTQSRAVNEDCQLDESTSGRAAKDDPHCRWPNGIVPYQFYKGPIQKMVYDPNEVKIINKAFEETSKYTNIKFYPKTQYSYDFVTIKRAKGESDVGRAGGEQFISFGTTPCFKYADILHEIMHLLGFVHEQNRMDRDQYITVLGQNINPVSMPQFARYKDTNTFNLPYDYESITHYAAYANSKNGKMTIITKDPKYQNIIGKVNNLSKQDIQQINLLYPKKGKGGMG